MEATKTGSDDLDVLIGKAESFLEDSLLLKTPFFMGMAEQFEYELDILRRCKRAEDDRASLRDLATRASAYFCGAETAPDQDWFRDYFTVLRIPMILTEEGWEEPSAAASYLEDDPEWEPLEVLSFDDPKPGVPT